MCDGSFFWMQLRKIRPHFNWSTQWHIGTGDSISYWFDSWTAPTVATIDTPVPANRKWSLKEAVQQGVLENTILNPSSADYIQWRWAKNKEYSAKSFYEMKISEGRTVSQYRYIWRLKIPPTVRVFALIFIQDKLLTQENMIRRRFNCAIRCEVCQTQTLESAMHLFFRCHIARLFWHTFSLKAGFQICHHGDTLQSVVANSHRAGRVRVGGSTWGSLFFGGCWHIWKNRNRLIFDGKGTHSMVLANQAIQEVRLWLKHC